MSTEALAIVAGVLVLILAVVAALLLVSRAGLRARLDAAGEDLARTRAERDARQADLDRAIDETREHTTLIENLRVEATSLSRQLEAAQRESALQADHAAQHLRSRLDDRDREHRQSLTAAAELHRTKLAALEDAKREIEAKLAQFDARFQQVFGSLAGDALQRATSQFIQMAAQTFDAKTKAAEAEIDKRRSAVDDLVRPIAETLRKTDEKLTAIEKERTSAYAGIEQQLRAAGEAQRELRAETGKLVAALRKPEVRGRWGEIQLERVVELAGMKPYCDYATQESSRDGSGHLLRPDLTVRLPNGRCVAVDAKTNIAAYIDAVEATDPDDARVCLDRFAQHISDQVTALARKGYWEQFERSPELVVMFVPGDQFIDAAMQRRPDLLERAAAQGVILASPSTLIGILRAVAVGWREHRLSEQAGELLALGKELHDRAGVFLTALSKVGASLGQTVERYNEAVGSAQSRLMPTLRKFAEAAGPQTRPPTEPADVVVRPRLLDALAPTSGRTAPPTLPPRATDPNEDAPPARLPG
jgi:DNA recombination protein RmuC